MFSPGPVTSQSEDSFKDGRCLPTGDKIPPVSSDQPHLKPPPLLLQLFSSLVHRDGFFFGFFYPVFYKERPKKGVVVFPHPDFRAR